MNAGILLAVLVYEIVIILGVGLWLARREAARPHGEGDFALAGRHLPVPVVAITLALTVLGTAHILGIFELAWFLGAAAVWFSLAHVILLVMVCLSTGLWVRRLGLTTVPEILDRLYGEKTRLLVSCTMAGVVFGILTIETQGIGIVISSMTGWEIRNGAIVGGILGIFYVVLAGMKEIGWLNLVNAIVMYLGLILATMFLAFRLPGGNFDSVAEFYTSSGDDFMLSIYGTPEIFMTFALGITIAVVFSQGINQMLMQPCMSAETEQTVRRSLWIAAPLNGMFGVFAVVIGLTAKTIPEFAELGPKVAATTMLVNYLPAWLAALLLASFLAAILSTFAMTSLAPATIIGVDIYKNLYRPDATEDEMASFLRKTIIALAVVAMSIAAFLPPILAAMEWLFSWLVPVFWVIVFGLFWKRSSTVAVLTLVAAWVANSLWSFSALPELLGMGGVTNPYVTLAVTLCVGIGGNLVSEGKNGYFRSSEYKSLMASSGAAG
ncbi:MAG TPA: sodium:solute symporter family protein [Gammaproteobacteria bacterium]